MGCKQSRQRDALRVVKIDKDVEVRRKFQIGLHLTKEEAGVQVTFGKTSRKKYELPEVIRMPREPAEPEVPAVDDSIPPVPSVLEVMRRDE